MFDFTDNEIPEEAVELDGLAQGEPLAGIVNDAPIHPLDQVAFHIDDALETKAMIDEADAMAAACPELQQQYIAQLERAGTKVREALHLARQHIADRPSAEINAAQSFVSRVEESRGDIALA
jgi:hypothetical protein